MATLQVEAMDDRLYEALGRRAAMDCRSISQEVTMIIREFLSAPNQSHRSRAEAALELAGTWEDDRCAEGIIADIHKSRRDSTDRFR